MLDVEIIKTLQILISNFDVICFFCGSVTIQISPGHLELYLYNPSHNINMPVGAIISGSVFKGADQYFLLRS